MDIIFALITATSIIKFTIETVEFIQNDQIRLSWINRINNIVSDTPKIEQLTIIEDKEDEWVDINNDWIFISNG